MVLENFSFLYVSQKCWSQTFDDQTNDYTNGLLSLDSTLGHVCLWHNLAIAHVSKSAAECTTLTKNFLTSLFCYWHRVLHAEFNDER